MLNFDFENQFNKPIIGVDEVGRGPWAGPTIAAACHFYQPKNKLIRLELFNDSKKLSKKEREVCFQHILKLRKLSIIEFSIGKSSVREIDKINILQASLLAMKRAISSFSYKNFLILIDGINHPKLNNLNCKTIIKGDQKSISIAAASIIAKIYRDKIMTKLSKKFANYGWNSNMGYGTKKHKKAIISFGITQHHRKSFKPIKNYT